MIKFALRRNLIYPFQLLLWDGLRDIDNALVYFYLSFDNSLIFTILMFLGEFFAGLILYLYQKIFLKNSKSRRSSNTLPYEFNKAKNNSTKDNKKKIYFLLITAAFFDFVQFLLSLRIPQFIKISYSLEQRLRGTYTMNTALFYRYALRLPIFKHQFFSLILIGICLIFIIIIEFIFQDINIFFSYSHLIFALLLIFITQFISALEDSVEKYLIEYNQLSPFLILMIEGILGFVFSIFYSLYSNPFNEINQYKKNRTISEFTLLTLALLLYMILSGGNNTFRLLTLKIYSPMTSTFMRYILNPFYIIYYFIFENDFISNNQSNYAYFIINLIISLILSFCGCVYNEFLILFCFGLERDTHNQVTKRSVTENEMSLLNVLFTNESDKDSEISDYIVHMQTLDEFNE